MRKFTRGDLYAMRAKVASGTSLDRDTVDALLEMLTEAVELPTSINTLTAHSLYRWRVKWVR